MSTHLEQQRVPSNVPTDLDLPIQNGDSRENVPSQNPLRYSILSTLVFYDQFSYPLTAWEIWRGLYKNLSFAIGHWQNSTISISFCDVVKILESDEELKKHVIFQEGYFCLEGRGEIIKIRHERLLLSLKKYKKVQWFLKIIAFLPFIRFVGICNSLAYKNARDESDVDLFVATEKGRAHEARMLAGFFAALFRMRPTKYSSKDKICLSFFADRENLNLSSLRIGENDIYFHYWIFHVRPIFDEADFWKKFCRENAWLENFLGENVFSQEFFSSLRLSKFFLFLKYRFESLLGFLLQGKIREWLFYFEEKKFSPNLKELKNLDTRVVITPGILKLHPDDRRLEYFQRFKKQLEKVMISR